MGTFCKVRDLNGERFGRLVVTKRMENNSRGQAYWQCVCDCGKVKCVRGGHLSGGLIKSCGCLNREVLTKMATTHNESNRTKEWISWNSMKGRCYNPNDKSFRNYGHRGISVCDRWRNSYESFLEDMGRSPNGFTLERIDNGGNYEPTNCIWASRVEQARNTRRNVWIKHNGLKMIQADWARLLGVSTQVLWNYIHRGKGHTIEDAIAHYKY